MANEKQHWAVLGGGMLGLTLALRLAQQGQRVTLIEAAPNLGGLTASFTYEDISWDRFYHVIEGGDAHLLALISELGLDSELTWGVTKTDFYDGQAIYPLNNVFDYLRLPVLGVVDKLRLAINILYGAQLKDGIALESQRVEDWLVRWSGRRTFEKLWRPLLRTKLGDNFEHASAAFIWAVIQRFYGARQGKTKTELFGYVRGGYARIIRELLRLLEQQGVIFEFATPVQGITSTASGVAIHTRETRHFDQAIVTFASPIAAHACTGLSAGERARHQAIRYQGVVCASVLLKRPLRGAYLTYITEQSIPFTTVIEMSSLVDPQTYGGRHLVYLPKYVPSDDPILKASDAEIEQLFIPALMRMFPDLSESDIDSIHVARTPYVTAIASLHYSANLPAMKTAMDGVYICNSAHIVNASLSVNETVDLANRAVAEMLA